MAKKWPFFDPFFLICHKTLENKYLNTFNLKFCAPYAKIWLVWRTLHYFASVWRGCRATSADISCRAAQWPIHRWAVWCQQGRYIYCSSDGSTPIGTHRPRSGRFFVYNFTCSVTCPNTHQTPSNFASKSQIQCSLRYNKRLCKIRDKFSFVDGSLYVCILAHIREHFNILSSTARYLTWCVLAKSVATASNDLYVYI